MTSFGLSLLEVFLGGLEAIGLPDNEHETGEVACHQPKPNNTLLHDALWANSTIEMSNCPKLPALCQY